MTIIWCNFHWEENMHYHNVLCKQIYCTMWHNSEWGGYVWICSLPKGASGGGGGHNVFPMEITELHVDLNQLDARWSNAVIQQGGGNHWSHGFPTRNLLPSEPLKNSVTDMWDYATCYLLRPPSSWTRRPWEEVRSFERSMARMAVKCWQFGEGGRIPAKIGYWSSCAMWSKGYREWLWSEAVPV